MENEKNFNEDQGVEKKETPDILYHGSVADNITELEPRTRSTPGGVEHPSDAVYAGDVPAFAAAHAFPWETSEGFMLSVEEGDRVVFRVPESARDRLKVPVYIYKLSGEGFSQTEGEGTGHTFDSKNPVKPTSVEAFADVQTAIEHYGGVVEYYNPHDA